MREHKRLFIILSAALAVVFGFHDGASAAKKKLTYEEAYAKCKAILDKEGAPGTSLTPNVRHTKGAGCMKKYGHKL